MTDIVALGEPLIEFTQLPGTSQYRQGFGGDTSNFAIAAARAGARSAFVGAVGDEPFGHLLMDLWQREGVDCGGVTCDPDAHTGIYFVSHGPDGHAFTYRRSASASTRWNLTPAARERIASARWLHVSGISQAIGEHACDVVFEAIALARQHGVAISYDLNYRPRLWPAARAAAIAKATLSHCDLFLPSIDEARLLFDTDDPLALVQQAHALGAKQVAVKLGPAGALVSDGRGTQRINPFPVQAIDATGAGDCFGGVTVTRLCAGDSLADAARAGAAAAALSTTGFGAIDPLPQRVRIRELLGLDDSTPW